MNPGRTDPPAGTVLRGRPAPCRAGGVPGLGVRRPGTAPTPLQALPAGLPPPPAHRPRTHPLGLLSGPPISHPECLLTCDGQVRRQRSPSRRAVSHTPNNGLSADEAQVTICVSLQPPKPGLSPTWHGAKKYRVDKGGARCAEDAPRGLWSQGELGLGRSKQARVGLHAWAEGDPAGGGGLSTNDSVGEAVVAPPRPRAKTRDGWRQEGAGGRDATGGPPRRRTEGRAASQRRARFPAAGALLSLQPLGRDQVRVPRGGGAVWLLHQESCPCALTGAWAGLTPRPWPQEPLPWGVVWPPAVPPCRSPF